MSFEDVVLGGLANDRGLYVPEVLPSVSPEELNEVRTKTLVNMLCTPLYCPLFLCVSVFRVIELVYCNYRACISS